MANFQQKKQKFPKLKNQLILAPMAGITDIAFRILCREQGAGLCFTEFASSEGIIRRDDLPRLPVVKSSKEDRPLAVQIFGNNPESMHKSAEKIIAMKNCDLIDINLGCPSAKIAECGAGGELLKHPEKIKKILTALCRLDFPVSCKFRSGIDENHVVALKVAEIAEEAGCCAVTLHPRTVVQGYSGKADWKLILKLKEKLNIPVIGNGDINNPKDAVRMLDETHCDYVMIGRAAMNDPTIFARTVYYMKNKKEKAVPAFQEKIKLLDRYFSLMKRFNVCSTAKMKIAACNFTKGYTNSAKLREKICRAKTEEEIQRYLYYQIQQ